ncbi:Rieske (2Fe-2S) protein [Spirochaeta africana]|uniref:Ferredoxin subunit of nitrite reductase and ring-hydroxylating dioxygenase n=1 Tax=Spirochaeta africana (strain ATCC 700263 / DSM 8902 / Z-7692) TaxID=889378 RepID=H9UJR2_SPIAZ|nr:non-heme iron oxygenase ferredoxin subunit [Spirochaeta africana]AFG37755.1 ferredoxin subunit of nitrite reductase and ring-hydroxylating dioxygenase [Spirochaeta africana DSM 8902]
MAKWVRAAHIDDFQRSHAFRHKRKYIALFKLEDGVYALDNVCSHEYSELSEGMVLDGSVYCPKHGSRFEVRTGKVLDLPATSNVKSYPVRIEDGEIFVQV